MKIVYPKKINCEKINQPWNLERGPKVRGVVLWQKGRVGKPIIQPGVS